MRSNQQGDIALYVALVLIIIMTSAAVVFSSLLSRQVPLSRSVVRTEQAFYAANSGLEEALFMLARKNISSDIDHQLDPNTIDYDEDKVTYRSYAHFSDDGDGTVCAGSQASVADLTRRVTMGGESCDE